MREHDEPWKAVRRDPPRGVLRPRPSGWRTAAAAASLFAVVSLAWGVYQESRVRALSAPGPGPEVLTLFPEGESFRGAPSDHTRLTASTPATLILPSRGEPSAFPSYEVLVEGDDGRALWRISGAKRGGDGAITVSFPAGLPEGDYRIRIVGIEGSHTRFLESYRVSARPRGP